MHLDFRAPGRALPLADLLARALPGEHWRSGAGLALPPQAVLDVAGRRATDLSEAPPPGTRITLALPGGDLPRFEPDSTRRAVVLTPAPAWSRGELFSQSGGSSGRVVRFEVRERRAAIAELLLETDPASVRSALTAIARAGFPALGDLRRGGVLVSGGTRVAIADARPTDWWPGEPVFAKSDRSPIYFSLSPAALRAVERGHPWVLPDDGSDDPARFAPGTLVELRGRGRKGGARSAKPIVAHTEGGRIAARLWSRSGERASADEVERRVDRALERRGSLVGSNRTDAFRLVHGEADGLPGLAVDRLGRLLRVLVSGRASDPFRPRVVDVLIDRLRGSLGDDPAVIEVLHLRDRPAGRLECVRRIRAARDLQAGKQKVRERGLSFLVEPGLSNPTRPSAGFGLYLDQRENRARIAKRARGGRWLNLFAHTGAFSVALLAGGAREVVSVDLSAAYLSWLRENLELNGLGDGRHREVRYDGRRFLSGEAPGTLGSDDRFDGIIIDPPTAAAAGRNFWSVARGLEPICAQALSRLVPGGTLLVSRNDRRSTGLDGLVERAAAHSGVELGDLQQAPAGRDFPQLSGFPEGRPFEAILATRA